MIDEPFQKWGLDMIGEIIPNLSKQHKFIMSATDFFTRWVEAIALKTITSDQIISFIEHNIITMLGLPNTLIFYNTSHFS